MKLVIESCKIGVTTPRSIEGGATEYWTEILYLGGRISTRNPKKHPPGDYASVSVIVDLKNEADMWMTKDRSRSGAMLSYSLKFDEIAEVSALKK